MKSPGGGGRHKRPGAWVTALFALSCVTAVVGCGGGTAGIFFTLANETETGNNSLQDDLTIAAVATVAGIHYVAAGSIWARGSAAVTWRTYT